MKVLMIAGGSEAGGAPKSMMEMIENLRRKYDVNITLLLCFDGKIAEYCRQNAIPYVIDGHRGIAMSRGSTTIRRIVKLVLRPYYFIKSFVGNKQALKIIEEKLAIDSFDIVHTNSNRDGIGALIRKKYDVKHIWHIREFGKEDYDVFFLPPFSIKRMNDLTDKFIMISKAVQNAWIDKGIEANKCNQIYNGINFDGIYSDPNRTLFKYKNLKIVFTGTICPSKGQIEIIEALGRIKSEKLQNIHLDFLGEGPKDYINFLKKRIIKLNLQEIISFKGYCNTVGDVLQNYNVGIVCSRAEAFGRITPEYMAAGLIVIASNTGANKEIIDDEVDGFLYEFNNYENLAEILVSVLDMDYARKIEISMNAEYKARKKYSAVMNADNIYRLYEDVLIES